MRARHPEPEFFLNEETAREVGVAEGDWAYVENTLGRVKAKVAIKDAMPPGLVRVPHGWWKPEMAQGIETLSGAYEYADAQLCRDDDEFLDREQGIPHIKGIPCRVVKVGDDNIAGKATNAAELEPAE